MNNEKDRFATDTIEASTSQWHSFTAKFQAHRFPGYPLADTNVTLNIPVFSINWNTRYQFAEELKALIKKYSI